MPAEAKEQIFDAFYTTKPHGTGMGLAISRTIVESHGGRVWASPGAGQGAIVQFTLPLDPSAASTGRKDADRFGTSDEPVDARSGRA
jgi:signal transduction histidine kinase